MIVLLSIPNFLYFTTIDNILLHLLYHCRYRILYFAFVDSLIFYCIYYN